MITKRRNPDGSLTVGIIEDEITPPKKPVEKAEVKETKPKTTTKKKSATK